MTFFSHKFKFLFVISILLLAGLPVNNSVSANNSSYLSTLPFDQPVGHTKDFTDFEGQKTVVVFGRITCWNTMQYIPYITSVA